MYTYIHMISLVPAEKPRIDQQGYLDRSGKLEKLLEHGIAPLVYHFL